MENENGNVIRNVLERIGRPATLSEISEEIADVSNFPIKELIPTVKRTLKGGVELGFLQCQNGQYYNTIERSEDSYFGFPTLGMAEVEKPVRGNLERLPKIRGNPGRRRNPVKPRPFTPRRIRPAPGATRGPGRPAAAMGATRGPGRLPAAMRATRGPGRAAAAMGATRGPRRPPAAMGATRGPGRSPAAMGATHGPRRPPAAMGATRGPGRPPAAMGATRGYRCMPGIKRGRGPGRLPTTTRGVRGAVPKLYMPPLMFIPKRAVRQPTVAKPRTGARGRKAILRGRPYKANVRVGNRGWR